jgi:hypothetical protein
MRRITPFLILLAGILLFPAVPAQAWLFGSDDTLVTIDGTRYSKDDFKRWWQFWNDEKRPLPPTPDPYVDFLLLSREARQMELDADPGFKRQVEVFVKSRALLMLKHEEVDSKIAVSDAEIRAAYERDYQPRWLVQRLEFRDDAMAATAWQELAAGTVTVDELVARSADLGGTVLTRENWLRPKRVDQGWEAIFTKLEVGAVADPAEHQHGNSLYLLKERKGGDDEDFAALREDIRRALWKKQESALTLALLNGFKEQYQVKVDEERIAAIDLNADEKTLSEDVVIATNRQNVTEKDFLVIARRHMDSRPLSAHALEEAEATSKLKNEIVAGIIAQNVTDWGALARHYEEKEPFKWEYDFHVRHRLVLALEQRLFLPGAKVTPEEIKRHYEENLARYTQPATVRITIVDDTQGAVEQLWADVLNGTQFDKALKNRVEQPILPQEIPANHLDPEVKVMVDKLTVGETSPIFTAQGSRVLVHLHARTPAVPLPLERVTENIRTRLTREKVDAQRREHLDKLKSRSRIEVRNRQWRAIQKELGEK